MVIVWDGKAVSGTINPGPDAIQVKAFDLNVTNWIVRFEADGKDASGAATRVAAEGSAVYDTDRSMDDLRSLEVVVDPGGEIFECICQGD